MANGKVKVNPNADTERDRSLDSFIEHNKRRTTLITKWRSGVSQEAVQILTGMDRDHTRDQWWENPEWAGGGGGFLGWL